MRRNRRTESNYAKYLAGLPINGNARKALADKGLIENTRKPQPRFMLGDAWRRLYVEPEGT